MHDKLITVQPHPDNPSGWAIYEGMKQVKFLNHNFFLEKDKAEQVAYSIRTIKNKEAIRKRLEENHLFNKICKQIKSEELYE